MAPKVLVCVPVGPEEAAQVAAGRTVTGPLQVFTVTAQLLDTFGLQPADDEEAEYAALLLAGLWSLREHGRRLVLIAMVPADQLSDGPETANGGRLLAELLAPSVEAWFSDDVGAPVAQVAAAIAGFDLDQAWEHPGVQSLHINHALLWHSVVELEKAWP